MTGYKVHRYALSGQVQDVSDYNNTSVLLVGGPYVVSEIDRIPAETAVMARLGQRCDVLELKPGSHRLKLMKIASESITNYGTMVIDLDPGMVYRVYAELSDVKGIPRIETVGPIAFPATDGSAIAQFVRLSEPSVLEGALYGYRVTAPGKPDSMYPIYDDDFASFFPMISPDGKKLHLVRLNGDKKTLYHDGKEYEFDSIVIFCFGTTMHCVRYSADSRHYLFVGKKGSEVRVYYDGLPQPPRSKLDGLPAFSPDGEKYLYVADNEAILNGEVVFSGDEVDGPNFGGRPFSPDSEHLFFVFKKGEQQHVWLDGNIGPGFESIYWLYNFIWSDDGEYFLYKAKKDNKFEILVNHVFVATLDVNPEKIAFGEGDESIVCSYRDGKNLVIKQFRNPLFADE